MDAIEKFKNYLELKNEKIKEELKEYRGHTEIQNWCTDIMTSKSIEYWIFQDFLLLLQNHSNELFGNFFLLSTGLLDSNLKVFECFQVVQYFVERNIENGILDDKPLELKKCFQLVNITYDMIYQIMYGDLLGDMYTAKKNLKGIKIPKELKSLDMEVIVKTHKKLKEHYLDKKTNYTRADIIKTIEALYDLGIEQHLCANIEIMLRKELENREKEKETINIPKQEGSNKKKESTNIPKQESSNKEVSSTLLTNKEYKNIIKEIKECYDERSGEVLKPMTEEDVTRIASKMIWIGYTRESINQFYQDVRRSKKSETTDSITKFANQYNQLEYYSKNSLELQQLLKDAITYLYETFGCFSEDDYAFWYQEFQKVLSQINWKIPNTFDYEYEQAEILFEQEKQKKKEF